ncbi:hypothetical protein [Synechococcus sp. GFB01]|uniref:hypothetical protein n=1 Tax=Synechococcus sp. GFB01 TaxID=1662190 RepID=UPI00064E3657|nr:hypothetical protein [Synechococcus sp. GFB01]KMM16505.1 hypothetical protein SYNGFB01_11040 [Synechococcus sp. GFB01]
MRISQFQKQRLLVLDADEAHCLADICALLVFVNHESGSVLSPKACGVLAQLFTALAEECQDV